MTTSIITGVGGFIGSNLAAELLNRGEKVIGVDNFSTGKEGNVEPLLSRDNFELLRFDLSDSLIHFPKKVERVFHFASPASPEKYMAMAMNTMEVNTSGTLSLLSYCLESGARLVFASTSEVYGDPLINPQSESYWGNVNPIGPRSVYDEAKRFGETLIAHFQRELKVDAGIIRIFNTYGPNMDPYDGRVVSTFIRQALTEQPLTIFGDGSQTRSFCYVDDLIAGIVAMGNSSYLGPINLGNPRENTLLELAEMVTSFVGGTGEIDFLDLPEDDPKVRNPDITLARSTLNWNPKVAIEDGIVKTADWMKQVLNRE